jgi:hypothetical protein
MVVANNNNEIDKTKNSGKWTTISMAMVMQPKASLEATGCRHWASACQYRPDGRHG